MKTICTCLKIFLCFFSSTSQGERDKPCLSFTNKKEKIIKNKIKKKVKAMSTVTFQIRKGQAKMYVMVSVSCTSLIPYSTSLLA